MLNYVIQCDKVFVKLSSKMPGYVTQGADFRDAEVILLLYRGLVKVTSGKKKETYKLGIKGEMSS